MKNLLIAMLVMLVTSSFAYSQSWTSLDYTNTERNYNVTVMNNGTLTFYNTSPAARADQIYTTTISNDQINDLNNFMLSAGFLSGDFNPNFMDKGGSTRTVQINMIERKPVTLNDNLGNKNDISNFQSLVARIEKLVPSNFWTDNGIPYGKKNKKNKHHKKDKENENHED